MQMCADLCATCIWTPAAPFELPGLNGGRPRHVHVLIMVDDFVKCLELAAYLNEETGMPDHSSWMTTKLTFVRWFSRFGLPDVVTTDNGTEFQGHFTRFCHDCGVTIIRTAVRSPQSNGIAERLVATVKDILTKRCTGDNMAWLSDLAATRMALMNRRHGAYTPHQLLFGTTMRMPTPLVRHLPAVSSVFAICGDMVCMNDTDLTEAQEEHVGRLVQRLE